MQYIYLDNAATTFPKPESVYLAIDHFNRKLGGNPGRGTGRSSLQSGRVLLETRDALARLFNIADSSQIAFTSNITEAINIALKGILNPGDHVITSSMEHNSVARPLAALQKLGIDWTIVPCGRDGINPADVEAAITPKTRLIAMLHASNLSGVIMPIDQIGRIARAHEVIFLLDSAQSAGVIPIDVAADNIDILTFTGHKGLLGPQGTGGLYVNPKISIRPLKQGGTGSYSESLAQPQEMPDILESGTPNTPGLAGLLAGISYIEEVGIKTIWAKEHELLKQLIAGINLIPKIKLYGPTDQLNRIAVLPINIEGMDCGELSFQLEKDHGIITRSGLHCTPLAHQTLGTMELGACRLSPGFFSTEEEIKYVINALRQIAAQNN